MTLVFTVVTAVVITALIVWGMRQAFLFETAVNSPDGEDLAGDVRCGGSVKDVD